MLGAVMGGAEGAFLLGVLGAAGGYFWAQRGAKAAGKPATAESPSQAAIAELRALVQALERRLLTAETELRSLRQQLQAGAAPAAVQDPPDMPAPVSVPEPVPEPAYEPVYEPVLVAAAVPAAAKPVPESDLPLPLPLPPVPPRPVRAPAPPAKPLRERLPAPIVQLIWGGNTLVKIGVFILFLGFVFLLRYTAERVTVPIELRYAGVALAGAAILALGWFLRQRRRDYALALQGMGVGVFYLSCLAAVKMHGLIAPEAGFGLLALVALLGAALAVLQNAPALAIIAALEGFASPVLMSSGSNRPVPLFLYLTILDLGIFAIAWFKAWRVLNLIGFVGTFALAAGWADKYYSPDQYGIAQPFLILFFLLFAFIGLLFARRTLAESQGSASPLQALKAVGRVDSALVFGTPITAFGLQYLLSRDFYQGPALSALVLAGFYLLLARLVFQRQKPGLALLAEAYAIVAAIFVTLAIPLGLEGQWTGAAWAVEGAGMFWLGARQQRPYARLLALLVLFGAACKLLGATVVDMTPGTPLLTGSLIGPLLLALSAFTVWALQRRLSATERAPVTQRHLGLLALWLGVGAGLLLPWQLLQPPFAALATALLALPLQYLWQQRGLAEFLPLSHALRLLAVGSFLCTLHRPADVGGEAAALASGWRGALAAGLIALSILGGALWSMLAQRRLWLAAQQAPQWSWAQQLGLAGGLGLLHLASLFGLGWNEAAILWPLTAVGVLFLSLRMRHDASACLALALPLCALGFLLLDWPSPAQQAEHRLFYALLGLGLGLLAQAWLMAGERQQKRPLGWANTWTARQPLPWLLPGWGLAAWLLAWHLEGWRMLSLAAPAGDWALALDVVLILGSSVLASWIARRRGWLELGAISAATLPGLIVAGLAYGGELPSQHWGWLLWPLALAWHLRLLRELPRWLEARLCAGLHVLGCWFFAALATLEAGHRAGLAFGETSGWAMAAWAGVPALLAWALSRPGVQGRWPVQAWRQAYLEWAMAPLAAGLLAWLWLGNLLCDGAAAPLPYLPLLNPLELAQALSLAALLAWWRSLYGGLRPELRALLAATALALITGLVLRSVHHLAGVAWDWEALWASRLAQAAVSIVWALCGVLAMVWGNRRLSRASWAAGAVLLGVVVAKLLLVEMADRGGLYRIVSFIGVGVLILVVGYFAPVPGKVENKEQAA
ncbi:putative membrane protein [Paucibacter oligotrophus]|uniref:Putative membrane protein n=1 Tax=Roseateles oligotrophus TaxID=1769250 RepID=A0A840L2Q3_9BURK|nr:DUF2339 domain-containing protein [Roseateles oligotrophus]MBB4842520.1 putative membrane protein [Roseateles oligotrophus]